MEKQRSTFLTFFALSAFVVLFGTRLVSGLPSAGGALAQGERAAVVWETPLPEALHARLYELAVVPGTARVLATSPTAVWQVDEKGTITELFHLHSQGSGGESATLAPDGSRVGVLIHDHHALSGFRLLTPEGEELARVASDTQFHYRIAPGGETFVGISAGGEHVPAKADKFVYTFYDASGKEMAVVESDNPRLPDSAYTDDGRGFLINNARGTALVDPTSGERLWATSQPARLLALSGTDAGILLVSDPEERSNVHAFRKGESLWTLALSGPARNMAVAANGRFLVATDRDTVHLLMPDSDQPVYSFKLPDESLAINDVTVNDSGLVAVGAQGEGLKSGVILLLDGNGRLMWEQDVTYSFSSAWVPGVAFDRSGQQLLAWTLEQLFLVAGE